jgi:hypothetical protein
VPNKVIAYSRKYKIPFSTLIDMGNKLHKYMQIMYRPCNLAHKQNQEKT